MKNDWKPVVRSFCKTLVKNGVELVGADDMGDFPDDSIIKTSNIDEIVEHVCAVDESYILVKTPSTDEGKHKVIYIVLGNGPEEIAADYTCDELIEKSCDEHYEKWENVRVPKIPY